MRKRLALIVLIAVALALPLAGCGVGAPAPVSVANSFFKAVRAADWDTVEKLSNGNNIGAFSRPPGEKERIVKALVSKMNFKVGPAVINGNQAEVKFDLTMPDVEQLMTRFVQEALPLAVTAVASENTTEEQARQMVEDKFIEILNDPKMPKTTYPGVARLEKGAGGWKVVAVEGVNLEGNPLLSE